MAGAHRIPINALRCGRPLGALVKCIHRKSLGENPLSPVEKPFRAELRHGVCADECYGNSQRREIIMSNSVKRALASVTQALVAVTDHLSGADIVRRDR